jgi:hypothetical protein
MGPSIVTWDIEKGERVGLIRAHKDLVTAIRAVGQTKEFITCTYGGEVSIWDQQWKRVATGRVRVRKSTHVSVDKTGTLLVVTSEYSGGCLTYLRRDGEHLRIEKEIKYLPFFFWLEPKFFQLKSSPISFSFTTFRGFYFFAELFETKDSKWFTFAVGTNGNTSSTAKDSLVVLDEAGTPLHSREGLSQAIIAHRHNAKNLMAVSYKGWKIPYFYPLADNCFVIIWPQVGLWKWLTWKP